ncbi:hypothetical protein SDC9_150846 [bioreactor metagenome]|uniref:Uncharacterized protein n=1 Tax=bioreactor metagenome TaxID=1076179 RepID=A0A645ENM1_9ZZZZ
MGGGPLHPVGGLKPPGKAGDGGAFQCLLFGHGRQNARKTLGQHGFARSRRADQQQAMGTDGCDLQRPSGHRLALHVRQIRA